MAKPGTVFLMYHELALPGRRLCQDEPGYTRFALSESDFRSQMHRLARDGWHAKSVSQAIQSFEAKDVCVTFDDGCETDLITAAPILKALGFAATFYITVGFLGHPGYMTEAQVRDLSTLGFEIGCHSLTHPYLPDLNNVRLREETAGAKGRLEQITGVAGEHFSCPGGRFDRRVIAAVKAAGFRTMATSQTGLNSARTDLFQLNRVTILSGANNESVIDACSGRGFIERRLKEMTRETLQRVLGNSAYDSLRGRILR